MSKMALTADEVVVIGRGILTRRVDAELEASSLFALAGLMLRTLLDPDQLPTDWPRSITKSTGPSMGSATNSPTGTKQIPSRRCRCPLDDGLLRVVQSRRLAREHISPAYVQLTKVILL